MNRRLLPLALGLIAACAGAEKPLQLEAASIDGTAQRAGQWVVGCSNQRTCTALASLGEGAHIAAVFTADIADPQSVAIVREGAEVEVFSPLGVHRLTQALLQPDQADKVSFSEAGPLYEVPQAGFAKAMELMAKWRRNLPAPDRSRIDTVIPLPAPLIHNIATHPLLADVVKLCPEGHMGESQQAWRGFAGRVLWRAGCGDEGLNPVSFWFIAGPQGAPPEPVVFEDGQSAATAYNSWFDEKTGYLRMTHYFGGHVIYRHEDCGIYRVYGWGVGGMELVERRFMPICGTGIGPESWITTYRATVFNAPDSGP